MAEPNKRPVTMEELLVSSLAQTSALAKLLIEKGIQSCHARSILHQHDGRDSSDSIFSIYSGRLIPVRFFPREGFIFP
jgi:hypothetical protein